MSRHPLRERPESPVEAADEVVVQFDLVSEQVVLGAGLADDGGRAKLVRAVGAADFHSDKHRAGWGVVLRLAERGMHFDEAAMRACCDDPGLVPYLLDLAERAAGQRNVASHVERMRWDGARMRAAGTAVPALLLALKKSSADPVEVRSAAAEVARCFDGYGSAEHIAPQGKTSEEQYVEIRMRMAGKASYPFGIEGLDVLPSGERLLIPGAAPRKVTLVTGVTGCGKTMLAAMMALGLWRQGRKVLYGAWEPGSGNAIEAMACMHLGMSRRAFKLGECTEQECLEHRDVMIEIERGVKLLSNPFGQGRRMESEDPRGRWRNRDTNQRRVEVLSQLIEASGCEVFVADLLERAFVDIKDPADEKLALYQLQEQTEHLGIHLVAVHQQLTKGAAFDRSRDHRPTLGGLTGSGAWAGIADLVVGVHREYLYRNVEDDRLELHVLKQRDGRYPVSLEFEYDGDHAAIRNAREFDYRSGEGAAELGDGLDAAFREPKRKGRPTKRHLEAVKDPSDDSDVGPY